MKSKYKMKKIILITMILAIMFIAIFLTFLHMQTLYKERIYNYYNQIIGIVAEKYPNMESEIIKDIFINPKSIDKDYLKNYGIEKEKIDIPNSVTSLIFKNSLYIVIIVSIAIGCILFIFIYYQKRQIKDIQKLDEYFKKIIRGEESLELKNEDEGLESIVKNDIYDMTMLLKEKNSSLSQNNKDFKKLIADISHQLKTPLTSLNLLNDLLYTDLPEDKRKEFLDSSAKELEKIHWLIKTLLNIAKLDSKTLILHKSNNNVSKMLEEIKKNFKAMCEAYSTQIILNIDLSCNIYCDKKWTEEAISNIIKNAIEHGSKNVTISSEENRIFTQIEISDDGEGISEKDINHIFDRFYKSENSKEESLGLGLAFCRSIINNQDGEIRVESEKNVGTKFIIKLYK